jgi:hypothetical protein
MGSYTAMVEFFLLATAALLAQARPLPGVFLLVVAWCAMNVVFAPLSAPTAISEHQVIGARRTVKIMATVFAIVVALAVFNA